MDANIIKVTQGGLWEEKEWEIKMNCEVFESEKPCNHCIDNGLKEYQGYDSKYYKQSWICPRAVIAMNEGCCNSTGVCLDCIIEASKELLVE